MSGATPRLALAALSLHSLSGFLCGQHAAQHASKSCHDFIRHCGLHSLARHTKQKTRLTIWHRCRMWMLLSATHVPGTQHAAGLLLAALCRAVGRAAGLRLAEGPQGPVSAPRSSQGSQEGCWVQGRDGGALPDKAGKLSPHVCTVCSYRARSQQVWLCCPHSLHC